MHNSRPMRLPFVAAPVLLHGRRARVRLARGERVVEAPARLLAELFERCDGGTPIGEIVRAMATRWDAADVRRLLAALERDGIVCDVSSAALSGWQYVRNPTWLPSRLDRTGVAALVEEADADGKKSAALRYRRAPRSPLLRLLERRRSDRSFSGAPVAAATIRALVWAAYGAQATRSARAGTLHRVVPSGGKLFPLRIHLVNLRQSAGLKRGVYRAHFASDGSVALVRIGVVRPELYRAFLDPEPLRRAQGVLFISGHLDRSMRKYGNRALLYAALEAGHAAQNVLLAATELRLAAVETGGFLEDHADPLLGLHERELLLTSIIFGAQDAAPPERADIEFSWEDFAPGQPQPGFFLGSATFDDKGPVSWGSDRDPLLARDKALAETYDRLGILTPRNLREAKWTELDHALDPRSVVAYDTAQYRRSGFPFRPFDPRRRYAWTEGWEQRSGRHVAVLADCVFYRNALPRKFQRRLYSAASTSGVAAYPTRDGAMQRAVLELIERDAFMRAWLARAVAPDISARSLPGEARRRIEALRALGVRIAVKDLTRDTVPVVLLFAQHAQKTFTAVTAAAAYLPEEALDHALRELEATVLVRLKGGGDAPHIEPRQVVSPQDHGTLYAQRAYFRRADRLALEGPQRSLAILAAHSARNWSALADRIHRNYGGLVLVDITPPGAALEGGRRKLHVLRALVAGLIPMTFGFDAEALGLPSARALVRAAERAKPLFPHPFA